MHTSQNENNFINFEIENVRIYITLDDGFFNLEKSESTIHSHNRYEFHLALEGRTYIETKSHIYQMDFPEGYIISPSTLHICKTDENSGVKSSFWFTFEKINKSVKRDIYHLFSKAFEGIDEVCKIEQAAKYIEILKQIMQEFYSESVFSEEKIKSCFSLLLISLAEELLPEKDSISKDARYVKTPAGEEKNLRRIIIEEYINRNYKKDISLENLAKILHLSTKQASRVFASEFGENFKPYITKFRIDISMEYLKQTDLPISKIANLTGYKSYNGLYKPFLKLCGISPEEYRRKTRTDS